MPLKLGPGHNSLEPYRPREVRKALPSSLDELFGDPATRPETWPWWEYLLLPLGLPVYVLSIAYPWFRKQGLVKLFVCFMATWLIYGGFAVTLDSRAGYGELMYERLRRDPPAGYYDTFYDHVGSYYCLPMGSLKSGGWPFGKTYLMGVGCASWLSYSIFDSLGMGQQAKWVKRQHGDVYRDYYRDGTFSTSYVWMGIAFFFSLLLLTPWLILLAFRALFTHLHISWGSQ